MSPHKKAILTFSVLVVTVAGGLVWWTQRHARQAIQEVRLEAEVSGRVLVDTKPLSPPALTGVTNWLSAADVRAVAMFRNQLFAATSGGLLSFDESGKLQKRFTVAEGLPEHDLTTLAVFQDRLYLGTRTSGLISFDGNTFIQYLFRTPAARQVSVLEAGPAYLLIGTLDGGLFDYDGSQFARRFQPAKGPKITAVTALEAVESRIYIGTQAAGLLVWREGELHSYGLADGLPSPHVTGFAVLGSSVYAATDAGTVRLTGETIEVISKIPNVTSLAAVNGKLFAGIVTGGIAEISPTSAASNKASAQYFGHSNLPEETKKLRTILHVDGQKLWALTTNGLYQLNQETPATAFEWKRWAAPPDSQILTDAHTNCLALDQQGRLWVGTFDHGIDLLSPVSGERLHHFQDETIREINYLLPSPENGNMVVATSAGLVAFDAALKAKKYDEKSAGLVGNNVAHVLPLPGYPLPGAPVSPQDAPLAVSTARGLTFLQSGISRSLTAFHGLTSNYLYSSELMAGKLYVGSLGGLMELEGLKVVRTWKIDNSRLSANWINALRAVNGVLYIGTYGGGVNALLPNEEIIRFEETAGMEINPNAMASDGQFLYVGTLDRGLLIYDLNRKVWKNRTGGLAAANVTGIVVTDSQVFVGTTGGITRIEKNRLVE